MGFFSIIGKMFKGEPVFQVQQDAQKQAEQQTVPQHDPTPSGSKVLPQVMIERWQCVPQGQGLHCELLIRNYSPGNVTLQRIEVMGLTDELGNTIDKGEEYEFVFNLAKRPLDMNQRECKLYFRDQTGDYFMALHQVEYQKLPDGTFNVLRFRLLPPIRDV